MWQTDDLDLEGVLKSLGTTNAEFSGKVAEVTQWVQKQPEFPEVMDDGRIRNFLILNKCDVAKAKTKIHAYYSVKVTEKDIFEGSNPRLPYLKTITEALYFVTLPKLTKDKYRVTVLKIRDGQLANHVRIIDALKYVSNVMELRLKSDLMLGDVFICDTKNASWRFCLKFTPRILYTTIVKFYENVLSSRLKACYLINAHPVLDKLFIVIKTLLKEKLASRLHVLKSPAMLQDYVSEEILPEDLGGTERSLEELQDGTKEVIKENQGWFDELDMLRKKQIEMKSKMG